MKDYALNERKIKKPINTKGESPLKVAKVSHQRRRENAITQPARNCFNHRAGCARV